MVWRIPAWAKRSTSSELGHLKLVSGDFLEDPGDQLQVSSDEPVAVFVSPREAPLL